MSKIRVTALAGGLFLAFAATLMASAPARA